MTSSIRRRVKGFKPDEDTSRKTNSRPLPRLARMDGPQRGVLRDWRSLGHGVRVSMAQTRRRSGPPDPIETPVIPLRAQLGRLNAGTYWPSVRTKR